MVAVLLMVAGCAAAVPATQSPAQSDRAAHHFTDDMSAAEGHWPTGAIAGGATGAYTGNGYRLALSGGGSVRVVARDFAAEVRGGLSTIETVTLTFDGAAGSAVVALGCGTIGTGIGDRPVDTALLELDAHGGLRIVGGGAAIPLRTAPALAFDPTATHRLTLRCDPSGTTIAATGEVDGGPPVTAMIPAPSEGGARTRHGTADLIPVLGLEIPAGGAAAVVFRSLVVDEAYPPQ